MIYVTENGVSEKMLCTDLCDDWRMQYFKDYINELLKGETTTWLNTKITQILLSGLYLSHCCHVPDLKLNVLSCFRSSQRLRTG